MPSSTFGTQLFAAVADSFPSGNILISPVSIAKALEMVVVGATEGSDTEMELKQVLGPPSLVVNNSRWRIRCSVDNCKLCMG